MKVLIISFDKILSEKLKEVLSKKHEVFIVKNTEEALTLIPHEIDIIVFDAISGAISEEEINQLYNQKFSKQKYVILYDELFPVDENNVQPPDKVLVLRDEALEKVPPLIEGEERKPVRINLVKTPVAQEVKVETQQPETSQAVGKPKVLIASFDKRLTDEVENLLKDKYEIEVVKNQRLVKEKGRGASVIVFDAISGTIAEKNLTELAEDPVLREKHYLILLDDLFPINVDKLDLPNKEVLNRDIPPKLIAEHVESMLQKIEMHPQFQEKPVQEELPQLEEEELVVEFHGGESLEEESLEEVVESQVAEPQESPVQKQIAHVGSVSLSLDENTIKAAIIEALSKELGGLREEVKMEVIGYARGILESVVREEIEKIFLELKIGNLIREETKRIVEEKLRELLS